MPDKDIQRRVLNDDAKIELRAKGDGDDSPGTLIGYAAVFDSLSENLGGFRELIKPGAFAANLAENPDVSARIQHEGGLTTIGRTTNGTLRVSEDERGLKYEVDLPSTSAGRDIAALVKRGDIDKSSFAFSLRDDGKTIPQEWDFDPDPAIRTLHNLNLHDVAPVDGPAYQNTSVQARAQAEHTMEMRLAELEAEKTERDYLKSMDTVIAEGIEQNREWENITK